LLREFLDDHIDLFSESLLIADSMSHFLWTMDRLATNIKSTTLSAPMQSAETPSSDSGAWSATMARGLKLGEDRNEIVAPGMSYNHHEATLRHVHTPPQTRVHSPARSVTRRTHVEFVKAATEKFSHLRNGDQVVLDGKSLQIADVVAVAK